MSAIGGKADIVRRHYFRVLQTSAGVSYTRLFFSACSASFSQAAAIFRSTSLFLRSEVLSAISVHIAACSRYAATVSLTGICAPHVFSRTQDAKPQHWVFVPALHIFNWNCGDGSQWLSIPSKSHYRFARVLAFEDRPKPWPPPLAEQCEIDQGERFGVLLLN